MPVETRANSLVARLFDRTAQEASPHLLQISGVSVAFGGVYALDAVDLDLPEFAVGAIVGPNGAGKTTLLNAICGLIRQNTTGAISFEGDPILGRNANKVAGAGIGRSFQDPRLIEGATVWENVVCGMHLHLGYSSFDQLWRRRRVSHAERAARERAELAIEFVGLADCRGLRAGSLSYGKRKLADIARAVVAGPRLLLLDEPSSGLDSGERDSVEALLREIRSSRRTTVLAVEHHMSLVRATASHVLGLQAGRVLACGTPEEVLDSPEFRDAIVGGSTPAASGDIKGVNT